MEFCKHCSKPILSDLENQVYCSSECWRESKAVTETDIGELEMEKQSALYVWSSIISMLVGLSIPFCFLMTYLILYTLDMEVNFLVMMGLLLGMGMLIDGSIVITEYADKKIAEGLSRVEGYTLASKRMFYPIIASTGTTLAAFIPMMFWPAREFRTRWEDLLLLQCPMMHQLHQKQEHFH